MPSFLQAALLHRAILVAPLSLVFGTLACSAASSDSDSEAIVAAPERFTFADAVVVAGEGVVPGTNDTEKVTRIVISDQSGVCERAKGELQVHANERAVMVRIPNGSLAVGAIEITGESTGSSLLDGALVCGGQQEVARGKGTMQIDALSPEVRGRIDLVFGSRRIQTPFVAKTCGGTVGLAFHCIEANGSTGSAPH